MTQHTKFPFLPNASGLEIGERTERRFVEAMSVCEPDEPIWFVDIEEASSLLDLRGVDFIAWVKYRSVRGLVPIPVQIKSSEKGRVLYYERHPKAKGAGVVVLVLGPNSSPASIRSALFNRLSEVRTKGLRYESYIGKLVHKPARGKILAVQQAIEERRTQRTRVPALPQEPARKPLTFIAPELSLPEQLWHKACSFLRQKRAA